ncbi:RNA-guided endonuclease TnpB family protein [Gudongella sp. SC589]|uniref:RNA-guided endonuclease TnpB family protein n=1 Tax=Gudongella sp. SC589 TaxID=3385990 RepID=UPI003904D370
MSQSSKETFQEKKGSQNYEKVRLQVALLHEKIANTRKDFLHKLSTTIVAENQTIVVEGLKPKNMIKNRRLYKSIADASWGIFLNMLEYKSSWYGRNYVQVDSFFPSSQLCSNCGYINQNTKKLHVRTWECPHCGAFHHRDENAAKNIKAEGLRIAS